MDRRKLDEMDADEQVELLKQHYDTENLGDVPRAEVLAAGAYPLEVKKRWYADRYNVLEVAYIADAQLDFLEWQAGMMDERPDGIKYDDPEEGSNILSTMEMAELAIRLDEIEDKVRRINQSRDRYKRKYERAEANVDRLKNKGRLYHLKRLILG